MPNGIIKMLYSGKEDKQFTKNPDINFFKSVYKSYSNFVKIPENIQVVTNYNINSSKNIKINLSDYNYDLIGELFLYFKLKTPITNNIIDFIDKIEFYSTIRTKSAIEDSNVVAVLIDATKGFGKQDKSILDEVIKSGKGLVIVVNKWDLIDKNTNTMKLFEEDIRSYFKSLDHYPMIFISTITKQRIHKVLVEAWELFQKGKRSISTKKLNDYLIEIIAKNPPPADAGRVVKIKYATQVSCEPSVLAFYTNFPDKIKVPYIRYLENQIRKFFDFQGIPLFLSFRKKYPALLELASKKC